MEHGARRLYLDGLNFALLLTVSLTRRPVARGATLCIFAEYMVDFLLTNLSTMMRLLHDL